MPQVDRERNADRAKATVAAVAFHALLGYALIAGLGFRLPAEAGEALKTFDVAAEPLPPPEASVPAPATVEEAEGAASPPDLRASPAPVVAPPPRIRLEIPPPVLTAREPAPSPSGSDVTAGASEAKGPGAGAGGEGSGPGSGGRGSGTGGGGLAARAQWVSGRLSNSDYLSVAGRNGVRGTVSVRFTVGADGRVSGCTVTKSGGEAALGPTTCRLIEQRFRYRPARDAEGRPVPQTLAKTYDYDWVPAARR